MFTGIIEATGTITGIERRDGDYRVTISSDALDFGDVREGDSICINGVCLTALDITGKSFHADISNETAALTTLSTLQTGDEVNLEKAMQANARFGGHIVSGHVDGMARLVSRTPDARSERLVFEAPAALAKYIAGKGSVCLDGVSLTVNSVDGNCFGVNIIPHTFEKTTFARLAPGQQVNLEVDLVSRYLERLLDARGDTDHAETEGLTLDKLLQSGFAGR